MPQVNRVERAAKKSDALHGRVLDLRFLDVRLAIGDSVSEMAPRLAATPDPLEPSFGDLDIKLPFTLWALRDILSTEPID